MNRVEIYIGTHYFSGWQSFTINMGIDRIARNFSISAAIYQDQFYDPNSEVKILYNGKLLLTGYIDAVSTSIESKNMMFNILGRSKTSVLVDSCFTGESNWKNQTTSQIIQNLISPFDIKLISKGLIDSTLKNFTIKEDDKVIDSLNQLIEANSMLIYDNAQGNLIVGNKSYETIEETLELEHNLININYNLAYNSVYSNYIVRTTDVNAETKQVDDAFIEVNLNNDLIKRKKPLVILQTGNTTKQACQKRANFEKDQRNLNIGSLSCSVNSPFRNKAEIWEVGKKVKVKVKEIGLDDFFVIRTCNISLNPDSLNTSLELIPQTK